MVRHISLFLLSLLFCSGCNTNPQMNDIINNQYEDIKAYSDQNAIYVGEWVGDQETKLWPIKIGKDGKVLMCVAKKGHSNVNGKVYIENGETFIIYEGGTRYKIISVDKEIMNLDFYGDEFKYYAGTVPDKCLESFKNFE